MATNTKGSPASGEGNDVLPFEDALKRLEGVVDSMESGDLPLEKLIQQFEEGTRLVKVCQGKLEQAELKIQKLEQTSDGEPGLKTVKIADGEE